MIIDSSALAAILLQEPEAESFFDLIIDDPQRKISAASILEISIVFHRKKGRNENQRIDRIVSALGLEIVGIDTDQLRFARDAFVRYGKGHHPAQLNFGDCFSYALAKQTGEPLLYKGTDFSLTDISSVVKP